MTYMQTSITILWVLVLIQFLFLYLLTRTFVKFTEKFKITDGNKTKIGDEIPKTSAKDQYGNSINSIDIKRTFSKLIFLSDSCGSCIKISEDLDQLSESESFLVVKENKNKKSSLNLNDQEHQFPIIRSSTVFHAYGVKQVPTIISISSEGRILNIDYSINTNDFLKIMNK